MSRKNVDVIKDFFKRNVEIKELEEVLAFRPDTIFGIDNVSAEKLKENKIYTIEDLANLSIENPPSMDILPKILIKWIKVAKLIERAIKEELKSQKKILMLGLDNAGKTSILSILQEKFSVIKNLLPTKGVKREKLDLFGYPIISWDLGGQVQYREKYYFHKPELYFGDSDLIIYVIDIQDSKRFEESIDYYEKVIRILDNLNEFPPILIVMNKSDQDVRRTLQWQKNVDAVKNKLSLINEEFKKFKFEFCDTTVFQKETIMQMFSKALMNVSETSEIIENILEDYTITIGGRALSLISMDGLIFGSFTKNNTDEMLINNTALLLQTLSNFHSSIGLIREKSILLELPSNNITIRGEKLFEYSDLQIPVYLW
ncbi:MAG: ADP-ribosylation factor-like protein, partial [Promethearchaeota archaeon]